MEYFMQVCFCARSCNDDKGNGSLLRKESLFWDLGFRSSGVGKAGGGTLLSEAVSWSSIPLR